MATDNPLDYVESDFDALKLQLINRLKATDAWKDSYESSTGTMLIEFFAHIGNMFNYMLERRAEEGYLKTARHRSSVIRLVDLINYTPKRKVSAAGTLRFTVVTAYDEIVHIPKYTECQTANAVKYTTDKDVSLISPSTSVDVSAVQGVKVDLTYTSDGTAGQTFDISDTAVENTNYTVLVDGVEWTEVSTFISSIASSKEYRLEHNYDDTLILFFGDDIRGMIPSNGAIITFRYIRSAGATGNVYQTDLITTLNSTIYDAAEVEVEDITVSNSTSFTNGDDEEGVEEVRAEAPQVFATGDRAVTRADFRAILLNYPSIATTNAWGENEESAPNYDMFNTAKLCIVLENWALPTDSFKTTLATYLYTLSMLTVKYEFVQAEILNVIAVLDIVVNTGYSLSQVQADVEEVLADEFQLGTTTILGTNKRHSNLCSAIDQLDGVNHHHLVLEIKKDLVAAYESGYEWGEILAGAPIKAGTLEVYAIVDSTAYLMAQDDELGSLTDVASGHSVSGYVNYTTGAVGVNFTPDVSGVYILYQQDTNGDVEVDEDEICKLYDVEVTAIAYVEE